MSLSRLCSLIQESLPQFPATESELDALNSSKEREILISLSKVLNNIRRWTNDLEWEEEGGSECGNAGCNLHSKEHECLTYIVVNLISVVNVSSQYVQHLVANIFMVISEFLVAYGSNWETFIDLLCICFEFALCNTFSHSVQPLMSGVENSKAITLNLSLIRSRLNNSTWTTMAGISGILRGIIKYLKREDHELVGVLWNSVSTSLIKNVCDVLNGIHNNSKTKDGTCSQEDALLLMNAGETELKILFLGNFVQLLCSLVGLTSYGEARTGSLNNSSVFKETCELVPRLLYCCHADEWSSRYGHILPYFRHKILMLMIRLSCHMQFDCSISIQWLELLRKYYQDILSKPMPQLDNHQDDILEGSPFLVCLYDQEGHHLSLRHIQRQAVFLFLRCSLSLIGSRKLSADLKCTCMTLISFFASDLTLCKYCYAVKKGRLELHDWLQEKVPFIMFSDNKMYQKKCIKFASSFIRLYMHEDEMLFEVLLQLFAMPFTADKLFSKEGRSCEDAEENILFHISNLFHPLLLFHVFLAELRYDHQLLLDYLISKDSGSKCAEYLLRCLRSVCDSWTLFIEMAVNESVDFQKSFKRKRAFCEDSCEDKSAKPLQNELSFSSEQDREEQGLGSMLYESRSVHFEDAKACLLSLKNSLRKLHRRKLFPYDPEVLIRRLTRFEELCDQHV